MLKDWLGHGIAAYHENLTIGIGDKSFYFGVQPNRDKPNDYWTTCKLEFNPAKVGGLPMFNAFYRRLIANCKYLDFKRFDVAIDIPVAREHVIMLKDSRRISSIEYSASNKTTYVGIRDKHGQVKLYNKQLESKLDYPLTRLEITMSYDNSTYKEFKRVFPRTLVVGGVDGLKDTDAVLFLACLEDQEYLNMLGRGKRKKIETLLVSASQQVFADEVQYKCILSDILSYGKGISVQKISDFEELEDVETPFVSVGNPYQGENLELGSD